MKTANSRLFRCLRLETLENRSLLSASPLLGSKVSLVGPLHLMKSASGPVVSHSTSFQGPIIPNLTATPTQTVSTVPKNGDVNPYGVAFVPSGVVTGGKLHAGDILVSNFNNSSNLQGTGTTIVDISASGKQTLFFKGPKGLGLTTALGVLKSGFVFVGNVPTTDGTSATVQQGSLLILDKNGNEVANLTSAALLDGPWDLTVNDNGSTAQVFVSNVLSGTVTRINVSISTQIPNVVVTSETQIASGYVHRTDPAALVVGPTGLVYDASSNVLYVAATGNNEIFAVAHAGTRQTDGGTGTVFISDPGHLHGPLGLAEAPNGDFLLSNGDAVRPNKTHPSEITEYTHSGHFVAQFSLDPAAGAAFGIAISSDNNQTRFAAVNDDPNVLEIWTLP
jgi:hypothetical protein